MAINIAICDSDKKICADIFSLIRAELPTAKISVFKSRDELLRAGNFFAIYFLDIKGVDGIFIAKILREREKILHTQPSVLIFVTGYSEYVTAAFDCRAFHYLLKPVDAKKFAEILSRAVAEVEKISAQAENFLLVKVGSETKKVFLHDIFYIESADKKVLIHTAENIFATYGKMDALEVALGESFFRCHRFFIVNLEKISAYSANSIQLVGGEKIFLAAKRYSDFVKSFMNYAKGGGAVNVS